MRRRVRKRGLGWLWVKHWTRRGFPLRISSFLSRHSQPQYSKIINKEFEIIPECGMAGVAWRNDAATEATMFFLLPFRPIKKWWQHMNCGSAILISRRQRRLPQHEIQMMKWIVKVEEDRLNPSNLLRLTQVIRLRGRPPFLWRGNFFLHLALPPPL